MSTDRELLELAAKAAGMNVLQRPWNDDDGWFFCVSHDRPAMHFRKSDNPHFHSAAWAPLADDGDALRLAVKLGMIVDPRYEKPEVWALNKVCYWRKGGELEAYSVIEFGVGTDLTELTRRAIVRAAAEIGKAMP